MAPRWWNRRWTGGSSLWGFGLKKVADRHRTGSAHGAGLSAELSDRPSLRRSEAIRFSGRIRGPDGHDAALRSLALDGPTFLNCVEVCLVPALTPGQIVVMDNLSTHQVQGVGQAIEAAGCDLWYLPACSPDLNPIEKLLSKVKAWLRRVEAPTFETVAGAIGDALRAVAADECLNYFRSCGYVD